MSLQLAKRRSEEAETNTIKEEKAWLKLVTSY
jgi:hypothetical protein